MGGLLTQRGHLAAAVTGWQDGKRSLVWIESSEVEATEDHQELWVSKYLCSLKVPRIIMMEERQRRLWVFEAEDPAYCNEVLRVGFLMINTMWVLLAIKAICIDAACGHVLNRRERTNI